MNGQQKVLGAFLSFPCWQKDVKTLMTKLSEICTKVNIQGNFPETYL